MPTQQASGRVTLDLDELLRSTEPIGKVCVHKMSGGWWAYIDLPAPVGCEAKVKSDSNCKTPTDAVLQMLDRLSKLRQAVSVEPALIEHK
jgi:hypothetical protein